MAKVNSRSSTTSNQVGVVMMFWLGSSLPNEPLEIDPKVYLKKCEQNPKSFEPSAVFEKFNLPANPNFSLTSQQIVNIEEDVILGFGEKLLGNSRDIEPEINRIVQNHFWDLV